MRACVRVCACVSACVYMYTSFPPAPSPARCGYRKYSSSLILIDFALKPNLLPSLTLVLVLCPISMPVPAFDFPLRLGYNFDTNTSRNHDKYDTVPIGTTPEQMSVSKRNM
ncbi:hypothetical protein EVAR_72683_1 [Eumeta japonica]|uniref:Uncharacterized protein n=1 Tax=Eumeta variegata TaxID=151549 RepID=A0A4C1SGH6_EUMVA|nr:hypothetical protein EVAR_72683_1 [Eumeta japonica]